MEERFSVLAGLSFTVYVVVSFVFWRRGLVEYGLGDTLSWPAAVVGALILVACVFTAKLMLIYLMDEYDAGCLVVFLYLGLSLLLLTGYWHTIKVGGAPQWILNPASALTLFWDQPPTWAKIGSYVISAL